MTGSVLAGVRRFVLPAQVLDPTLELLARVGRSGMEAFVAWGGKADGETLRFTSAYFPGQAPHATPEGLSVTLTGEALFRANIAMYERGEVMAAQVHTHPTEAYHSELDDTFPIVTLLGAVSLVVPDFARDGRAGASGWAWYRLVGLRDFRLFDPACVEVQP